MVSFAEAGNVSKKWPWYVAAKQIKINAITFTGLVHIQLIVIEPGSPPRTSQLSLDVTQRQCHCALVCQTALSLPQRGKNEVHHLLKHGPLQLELNEAPLWL